MAIDHARGFGAGISRRCADMRRGRPVAEVLEGRQLLATITVTSAGDADGADGSNTLSLRQAIEVANGTLAVSSLTQAQQGLVVGDPTITPAPPNEIDFNIPGTGPSTIAATSPLPAITKPVFINGYSAPGSHPNTNGPDQADNAVLQIGLDFSAASDATVGMTISSPYCVVEGLAIGGVKDGVGLSLFQTNSTYPSNAGDAILGNFFGTDPTGTKALPNSVGIETQDDANTIGGTTPFAQNVISGNSGPGVFLTDSDNLVEGDLIGTDPTGTKALPNGVGIQVEVGNSNTVGGTAAGAGNVISGNLGDGVQFVYEFTGVGSGITVALPSTDNLFQGNFIGTDLTGKTALPNGGDGVSLDGGSSNTIGGTAAGAGNVIAFNAKTGVVVPNTPSGAQGFPTDHNDDETISGNSIFGNTGLGIDLGDDGVTPNNPAGDPTGPNLLQPYPVLTSATFGTNGTTISGTLDALPSTSYSVEFFANPAADPTGYGQGQTYLGSTTVTTNASGQASIAFIVPSDLAGQFISATATDPTGNTSEFAKDISTTTSEPGSTTTTLIGPPAPSTFGQPVPLAAVVTTTPGITPTGDVVFGANGVVLGETPVNADGVALIFTTMLPPGVDVVSAVYLGDSSTATSLSNFVAVDITTPIPSTTLIGPAASTPAGQAVTLAAVVAPSAPGGAVPTGMVAFAENGVILGEAPVNASGVAVFITDAIPAGDHIVAAVYLGDATYPPSLSNYAAVDVTPKPAKSSVTVKTNAVKASSVAASHPVGPKRPAQTSGDL